MDALGIERGIIFLAPDGTLVASLDEGAKSKALYGAVGHRLLRRRHRRWISYGLYVRLISFILSSFDL